MADQPTAPGSIIGPHSHQRRRYNRGSEEFGRFLAFTDGVVAIAMTLLVLAIEMPTPAPGTEATADVFAIVGDLGEQIWAFVLSFVIVGFYWVIHHRFIAALEGVTGPMFVWNFAFLLVIVLMPLQSQIIGLYPGNEQAVILYAASFVVIGLVSASGYLLARQQRLLGREHSIREARAHVADILVAPAIFLLSMLVAIFVSPALAMWSWFLIWPASYLTTRFYSGAFAD